MNFLKKTLGKEEPRRDPPKFPSSFTRKHQTVQIWNNNIQDLIEKTHKKQETSFDRHINKIVEDRIKLPKSLSQEEYSNILDLLVEMYKKYDKVSKTEKGNIKWVVCGDLIKKLKYKMDDTKVSKFIHELELEMMMNQRDEKRKKIEEFDTMVSFKNYKNNTQKQEVEKEIKGLKSTQISKQKDKQKQKEKEEKKNSSLNRSQNLSKKKVHNKSAKNLSSSSLKRQTNLSRKKSQGDIQFNKLQNLLKDVSTKVVKGNIQYDYSSILEASKSSIQCRKNNRNMTQKQQPKTIQKKVKKNEAFVFYRPGK